MDKDLYTQVSLYFLSKKVIHGISNTGFSSFANEYSHALIYGVPHKSFIDLSSYRESLLEEAINQCKQEIHEIELYLTELFHVADIPFCIPPVAQDDEIDLKAQFSSKDAAASAGLGWIGKNDLLISELYGPRIRLGAILFNSRIKFNASCTESRCPVNCTLCVNACPFELLHGATWAQGMKRDDLIKYSDCNAKRSMYIKKYNRKSSCGLCLVACPIGKDNFNLATAST